MGGVCARRLILGAGNPRELFLQIEGEGGPRNTRKAQKRKRLSVFSVYSVDQIECGPEIVRIAADAKFVSSAGMKFLPLLLALATCCAAPIFAQKTETKKPDLKKPAVPAEPAAPAEKIKEVTPEEVEKLLTANKNIVVLDVRTPEEYQMGHLAGATNISFIDTEFDKNVQAVAGKTIVLHCASGSRSTKALELLKTKDFPMIYHMNGGYKAWVAAGKPVVK
jgi:phage shock protein E